ncbi:DNA helicase-2 / ATP-dependent DNA helicase PcrA [Saccharicrinis carchari]|uniref:DNA 3'-5' helicase n=1 Tax=Saccharicrinis carchari TaxID=1168039 RepID=A0A521FBV8_SACCC|nr:ATP-dependent helicase [Saccharicrinis carchari]SMO93564.1 DNA helicase-2 / ATP-dependent DNA helicase PcrA [Saccharicrinis carchari]
MRITANTNIDIEQHFKVIAGPGAGKTRFLVNHVKNVLSNSCRLSRNRKIACITYTNVGVDTLIRRVEDEKDHLEISTIHSFLFTHVVKPYLFLIKEKFNLDPAKIENPFEHIFSKGYYSQTDLPRRYVSENDMKRVYWEISGNECNLRIKNKNNIYHKSLIKYKMFFWEKGIMHYDDILAFAWEIINKDSNVLRVLRAKFPYFFIDEFQDTSPIQTQIVKEIAAKETIIGVIGDTAQSIYSFQGASMQQFIDFTLPSLSIYQIEDNWRSTNQILKVLKSIRTDLEQESPENKNGNTPKILVGNSIQALEYCDNLLGKDNVVTLSYMVPTANAMRKRIDIDNPANILVEEHFSADSNSKRKRLIISSIKAIEFARQQLFSDAIKELSYYFRKQDDFKGQKISLTFLKASLNKYSIITNMTLWDYYQSLSLKPFISISKIREGKNGNMTAIESFYKKTTYKDIALSIRLLKDESIHRTIHKAKGDEFDNVLVVVKGRFGRQYVETRDLAFLLTPDLIANEDHRVNYVACSRARENLLINVPELSNNSKQILADKFEIIDMPSP